MGGCRRLGQSQLKYKLSTEDTRRVGVNAGTARRERLDKIFVQGLEIECVIGVWEWERQITQKLIIDLEMGWDIAPAAKTDALEDTLSYKDVAKRVSAFVIETKANLVETLAEGIATLLQDEFAVPWCRVRINKRGAVTGARDVGVDIERGQL